MLRLIALLIVLVMSVSLASLRLQTPAPAPDTAPDSQFSASRAMNDVRRIAQAPHPTGSAENAQVRAYLIARMQAMGLEVSEQTAPLPETSIARLRRWGEEVPDDQSLTNLIGVVRGSDPANRAVLLMAHHDTVAGSPGAADDSAGVAVILESVRAILAANSRPQRDLIVLLTDAEELGLDGARAFFDSHPLRERVGVVLNLEARGGGGLAMMFETGRDNAGMVHLYARHAPRPATNSLAAFVYDAMPNGTDFTIPKDEGIAGLNQAFIGRPSQYHDPSATADALDQGAVQHMGDNTLALTRALLETPRLPAPGPDRVFADYLGFFVLIHGPLFGWVLVLVSLACIVGAALLARRHDRLSLLDAGHGVLSGVWLVVMGAIVAGAVRLAAGPPMTRASSPELYYTLLRRLPWLEAGLVSAALGLLVLVMATGLHAGSRSARGFAMALIGAIWFVPLAALGFLGLSPVPLLISLAMLLAACIMWWTLAGRRPAPLAAWLGVLALILALSLPVQAMVPVTAHMLLWPLTLASLAAVLVAWKDPDIRHPATLIGLGVMAVIITAWLMVFGHNGFLGIGMDLPAIVMVVALLALLALRPLQPEPGARVLMPLALALVVGGIAIAGLGRVLEPEVRSADGVQMTAHRH